MHLGLDKAKIGEFLGEKDDFHLLVLDAYAQVRSRVRISMEMEKPTVLNFTQLRADLLLRKRAARRSAEMLPPGKE